MPRKFADFTMWFDIVNQYKSLKSRNRVVNNGVWGTSVGFLWDAKVGELVAAHYSVEQAEEMAYSWLQQYLGQYYPTEGNGLIQMDETVRGLTDG